MFNTIAAHGISSPGSTGLKKLFSTEPKARGAAGASGSKEELAPPAAACVSIHPFPASLAMITRNSGWGGGYRSGGLPLLL